MAITRIRNKQRKKSKTLMEIRSIIADICSIAGFLFAIYTIAKEFL